MIDERPRVLILPGWLDSEPAHWQSRWEALHGFQRVEQADWLWPRRGDWMARLEDVLLADPTPAILVAHSLGCHLAAAWAAHSAHTGRVRGALLVAPPDIERADMPPQVAAWRPIVRQRLPFRAIVLYSDDDPYSAPARALETAAGWGACAQSLGPLGHVNAESGLGDWQAGVALLAELGR
jgi:predicted alpha/beta hydrolase family esterase